MTFGVEGENFDIKLAEKNKSQFGEINSLNENALISSEEVVSKISLYNETYDIIKKEERGYLKIEKKWITTKKKIEIPIRHEEILINGKTLDYFDENELVEIFSKLKNKLSEVFVNERSSTEDTTKPKLPESKIQVLNSKHISMNHDKKIINQKMVPLTDISNNNLDDSGKIELWGEEIVINKKLVKLGDVMLKKYEIQEKRKIDIELKKDKLTLKFPGNYKEEIM